MSAYNERGELVVGTKIRFIGVKPEILDKYGQDHKLVDVTLGKVYTIKGHDFTGTAFFIDDAGDPDNAAGAYGGHGLYEVVTGEV